MEEFSYWEVRYISCEGNDRWSIARTPIDWNSYDVRSSIQLGGCGDDVSEILEIEMTFPGDYSWDFS